MKIAYIVSSLANAGPINVVMDLVQVMMLHGHQCVVYYFDEKVEKDFPCEMIRISMRSDICFNRYDVVHTHGVRPDFFVLLKKPLKCRTRFISTIHSFIFEDHRYKYGKFKAFFTTRITLFCTMRHNKVIVLSRTAKEYYKSWISSEQLTYAYNTRVVNFNQDITEEEKKIFLSFRAETPQIAGAICGVSALKGLDQMIQALQELPQVGFIIIGDGPAKLSLEQLAQKCGVDKRVHFLGRQPQAYRYLPYIDVFTIPSHSEGFPLAMLEAAAYSKAIVSSDIPIFKEIFTDEEVLKFRLGDIKGAVLALQKAFQNKSMLEKNVNNRYVKDYSPELFYSRHLDIYNGKM